MKTSALNSQFFSIAGFWTLAVFFVALPFAPALSEVMFVFALLSWTALKIMTKNFRIELPKVLLLPAGLYFAWVIITLFFSEYPAQSVRGVFKVFQQIMVFIIAAELLRESRNLSLIEKVIAVSFILFLVDGFYQYAFGVDFLRKRDIHESSSGLRVCGPFKTYGLYASYLLVSIFYVAVLFNEWFRDHKSIIFRTTYLFLILGAATLIFYTRSRGAILAAIFTVILILVYKKKRVWVYAFALMAFCGIMMMPRNMIIHVDKDQKEQSIFERMDLWQRAWNVIEAKPVTGTGINTYVVAQPKYDKIKSDRVQYYYAHSGYLQKAAEIGLVGLGIYLWFILAYFIWNIRRLNSPPAFVQIRGGLLASAVSFLIYALSDTIMHNDQAVLQFWFMLGLQMAYALGQNRKISL